MRTALSKPLSTVGIVGAAFDKGQSKDGPQNAPQIIRTSGLKQILQEMGVKVTDYGDITQPEAAEREVILNCKNQRAFVAASLDLEEATKKSVSENDFTLILGGDHSLATGGIMGHVDAYPNSFVVWVDAHADINTPRSSATGNIHGMPLSFVIQETGNLIQRVQGFEHLKSTLRADQLIFIGLRDVEKYELEFLKEFKMTYFDMHDVKALGIENIMTIILRMITARQPNCHIHLSFDIDALDPTYAPSTGTPVSGGLNLDEGKYICRSLALTGQLRSMAIAEVNPALGSQEDVINTLLSATELLKSSLLQD